MRPIELPLINRLIASIDTPNRYPPTSREFTKGAHCLWSQHPGHAKVAKMITDQIAQCRASTQRQAEGKVLMSIKGLPSTPAEFQDKVFQEMARLEMATAKRLAKKYGMHSRYVAH